MTPEIEALRAAWMDAKDRLAEAKRAEAEAMDVLDAKIAAWALADLHDRGIELGVTPVEGCRWLPREGVKPHFQRENLAVVKVTARMGQARYQVQKLTKTGALSRAMGAQDGAYVLVRKVGDE